AAWKAMQAENMTLIEEAFSPLPLLKAPMFNLEIGGLEMLQRLAETLYGDSDPARQMFAGLTHRIEPDGNGGYRLLVALPFADRDDMDLYRSADEITLRVGPYRRNIVLPYALWQLEIKDATFKDNTLNIHFIPA